MVVDSSVVLAVLLNDRHAVWAAQHLNKYLGELKMSVVNLTEVLIILRDRQPKLIDTLQQALNEMPIEFMPVVPSDAEIAARARHQYPLNLGDCFAYALAKR
jgi:uncharacterized protein with PIN domain